jgi:hypothetical protein
MKKLSSAFIVLALALAYSQVAPATPIVGAVKTNVSPNNTVGAFLGVGGGSSAGSNNSVGPVSLTVVFDSVSSSTFMGVTPGTIFASFDKALTITGPVEGITKEIVFVTMKDGGYEDRVIDNCNNLAIASKTTNQPLTVSMGRAGLDCGIDYFDDGNHPIPLYSVTLPLIGDCGVSCSIGSP